MSSSNKTDKVSDPVPNSEIEDVLSSIRRLVSEEVTKPRDGRSSDPISRETFRSGRGRPSPPTGDRLVLTPALRVGAVQEEPAGEPATARETTSEDSFDFERSPDAAQVASEAVTEDTARQAEQTPEAAAAEQGAAGDVNGEAPETGPAPKDIFPMRSALEAKIAELEAMIGARQEEWDPEGEEQEAFAGRVDALEWVDHDPEAESPDEAEAEDALTSDAADAPETDVAAAVAAATAAPAEARQPSDLEAAPEAETQSDADAETDAEEPFEEVPLAAFESRRRGDRTSSAPTTQAPEAAPVKADDEGTDGDGLPGGAGATTEDAVIDEEALRALVSEVLREELQGALGERITRNVRKLVRREIHRALTSKSFE